MYIFFVVRYLPIAGPLKGPNTSCQSEYGKKIS